MTKAKQDDRPGQGKQAPQGGRKGGTKQPNRDEQRTTSRSADRSGNDQQAAKGPGREGATGGAGGKLPRNEHGRQDNNQRTEPQPNEAEVEPGYQKHGDRDETKGDPDGAW